MPEGQSEPVVLYVCTTCRAEGDGDGPRAGARLLASIERVLAETPVPGLRVEPVECLSVCKRPCTVAVAGADRWTYVYGDLHPEASAPTIIEGIRLYAGTADGLVPWRARPEAFRKGVIARIPPRASA
ncbi:DUF1636 domain-containing protein [Methylobacterium durans]|uniref:DUF1636 domain-containing protein n=1 Tax=Methylobacterium durans TaxID=2202825 RepID=UPI002AFFE81C|nr:DUF1636 domain-containing protein [Methylobacterium durans]MEA1834145.1 DUF1636 domain-containing protein [Methylobacterium durans]